MIEDVIRIPHITYSYERGFFRDIIQNNDSSFKTGFGQSYSLVCPDIIKAGYGHMEQTLFNCFAMCLIKAALHYSRLDLFTYRETMDFFVLENHQAPIYSFPRGVRHEYKCSNRQMHLSYIYFGIFEPSGEIRIFNNYNDDIIG